MTINLGVVMDPIQFININKDSTFALLLEAQNRDYRIYYMEIHDLYLENDQAYSKVKLLTVKNNIKNWFSFSKTNNNFLLKKLDVILMRKDPPVNEQYLYATHILEKAENEGVLIINKPSSLRNFNEKLYATCFPSFIPNTLVSSNISKINQFLIKNQDIILKPLNGMAGLSIFRIKINDPNSAVIIETMTHHGTKFCISQIYIPDIKYGDKRILIINGKVFPWCIARIPQINENRGNLSVGGLGKVQKLTQTDLSLATMVGSQLKKNGLFFVGLDVIGKFITEINITSPTCIREIESHCKISISNIIVNNIEKKINKQ